MKASIFALAALVSSVTLVGALPMEPPEWDPSKDTGKLFPIAHFNVPKDGDEPHLQRSKSSRLTTPLLDRPWGSMSSSANEEMRGRKSGTVSNRVYMAQGGKFPVWDPKISKYVDPKTGKPVEQ